MNILSVAMATNMYLWIYLCSAILLPWTTGSMFPNTISAQRPNVVPILKNIQLQSGTFTKFIDTGAKYLNFSGFTPIFSYKQGMLFSFLTDDNRLNQIICYFNLKIHFFENFERRNFNRSKVTWLCHCILKYVKLFS